jgi:hypothetical protein
MRSPLGITIFIAIMLLLDTYVFQAIKTVSHSASPRTRAIIYIVYWSITAIAVTSILIFAFTDHSFLGKKFRTYLFATIIGLFLAKIVAVLFFFIDDVRRLIQWIAGKFTAKKALEVAGDDRISRSTFLSWLGLAAGGTLFGSLIYGFSNKYNYEIKRVQIPF